MGGAGVPGSHWGKVSILHQANADTGLVPLLSLWSHTKVSDHTKASHCPVQLTDPEIYSRDAAAQAGIGCLP